MLLLVLIPSAAHASCIFVLSSQLQNSSSTLPFDNSSSLDSYNGSLLRRIPTTSSNTSLLSSSTIHEAAALFSAVTPALPPVYPSSPYSQQSTLLGDAASLNSSIDDWLGLQEAVGYGVGIPKLPLPPGDMDSEDVNLTLKREMRRLSLAVNDWKSGWVGGMHVSIHIETWPSIRLTLRLTCLCLLTANRTSHPQC